MITLRIEIGKKFFTYEPQRDITAYEAAQIFKLILVASHALVPNDQRVAFINEHGLLRHFKEVEQ